MADLELAEAADTIEELLHQAGASALRILEAWHKDPVTLQPYATFRATTPSGLEVTATREGLICYPSARLSPTQALELAGALRVVAEWVTHRRCSE